MIHSRNLLICLCLAACTSPKNEATEKANDKGDSIAVDVPRAARHEPTSSENGLTFEIDSALYSQELIIFGRNESIPYWITKFYSQDHLIKSKNDTPSYSIKS